MLQGAVAIRTIATDYQSLVRRAIAALQRRERVKFIEAAVALIEVGAPLEHGWRTIAAALLDYGELRLARRAADALARSNVSSARMEQATIYARTGLVTEAREIASTIPSDLPISAAEAYLRGTLALNDGDIPEAQGALLDAARLMPSSGQIWQTLATTGSMASSHDVREAILGAEQLMVNAPEADRAIYLYALGKTLEDVGQHAAAYTAFASGAAIIASFRRYDHIRDMRNAQSVKNWGHNDLNALQTPSFDEGKRPIFVTGLPRSGSTLVEHILSSHSAVVGGEELTRFPMIIDEFGGSDVASVLKWASNNGMQHAAAHYLHLFAERFGTVGRAVDKTLETSRYLGIIAAALPDAPIVWMRRNLADNAWSCFKTYFLLGLDWSFDVRAIAQHFSLEAEMMKHWQNLLGHRILFVDYEKLVTDKDFEIRRILKHCDLQLEPEVFTPDRQKRAVITSSVIQVRRPIDRSSIGAAGKYPIFAETFLRHYDLATSTAAAL